MRSRYEYSPDVIMKSPNHLVPLRNRFKKSNINELPGWRSSDSKSPDYIRVTSTKPFKVNEQKDYHSKLFFATDQKLPFLLPSKFDKKANKKQIGKVVSQKVLTHLGLKDLQKQKMQKSSILVLVEREKHAEDHEQPVMKAVFSHRSAMGIHETERKSLKLNPEKKLEEINVIDSVSPRSKSRESYEEYEEIINSSRGDSGKDNVTKNLDHEILKEKLENIEEKVEEMLKKHFIPREVVLNKAKAHSKIEDSLVEKQIHLIHSIDKHENPAEFIKEDDYESSKVSLSEEDHTDVGGNNEFHVKTKAEVLLGNELKSVEKSESIDLSEHTEDLNEEEQNTQSLLNTKQPKKEKYVTFEEYAEKTETLQESSASKLDYPPVVSLNHRIPYNRIFENDFDFDSYGQYRKSQKVFNESSESDDIAESDEESSETLNSEMKEIKRNKKIAKHSTTPANMLHPLKVKQNYKETSEPTLKTLELEFKLPDTKDQALTQRTKERRKRKNFTVGMIGPRRFFKKHRAGGKQKNRENSRKNAKIHGKQMESADNPESEAHNAVAKKSIIKQSSLKSSGKSEYKSQSPVNFDSASLMSPIESSPKADFKDFQAPSKSVSIKSHQRKSSHQTSELMTPRLSQNQIKLPSSRPSHLQIKTQRSLKHYKNSIRSPISKPAKSKRKLKKKDSSLDSVKLSIKISEPPKSPEESEAIKIDESKMNRKKSIENLNDMSNKALLGVGHTRQKQGSRRKFPEDSESISRSSSREAPNIEKKLGEIRGNRNRRRITAKKTANENLEDSNSDALNSVESESKNSDDYEGDFSDFSEIEPENSRYSIMKQLELEQKYKNKVENHDSRKTSLAGMKFLKNFLIGEIKKKIQTMDAATNFIYNFSFSILQCVNNLIKYNTFTKMSQSRRHKDIKLKQQKSIKEDIFGKDLANGKLRINKKITDRKTSMNKPLPITPQRSAKAVKKPTASSFYSREIALKTITSLKSSSERGANDKRKLINKEKTKNHEKQELIEIESLGSESSESESLLPDPSKRSLCYELAHQDLTLQIAKELLKQYTKGGLKNGSENGSGSESLDTDRSSEYNSDFELQEEINQFSSKINRKPQQFAFSPNVNFKFMKHTPMLYNFKELQEGNYEVDFENLIRLSFKNRFFALKEMEINKNTGKNEEMLKVCTDGELTEEQKYQIRMQKIKFKNKRTRKNKEKEEGLEENNEKKMTAGVESSKRFEEDAVVKKIVPIEGGDLEERVYLRIKSPPVSNYHLFSK